MKKVLVCCSSFYPAYKSGGPVRSLSNLVEELGDVAMLDVISSDRDMGDVESFVGVNVNSWSNSYKGANVHYQSPEFHFTFNLREVFFNKSYDVIYLNSFFDFKFSIRFLLLVLIGRVKAKEILLAPRGELSAGAMSLKPFKKKLYLLLFKFFRGREKVKFHFTSQEEVDEAIGLLGASTYQLIPNMHETPPSYFKKIKDVNSINIIFLSRISPKKNLIVILKTLAMLYEGDVNLTIAGTIDDKSYWEKCMSLIKCLPANINVTFLGPLDRVQVKEELNKSHLFFLPTLNENYGHAIVEAMMHSNIVIISDQTPWSGVSMHGSFVGDVYDIPYYLESIEKIISMNENDFNVATRKTYNFSNAILDSNVSQIKQMFN
jgi:glycosyltransferase involved in cell wall biosynthesis